MLARDACILQSPSQGPWLGRRAPWGGEGQPERGTHSPEDRASAAPGGLLFIRLCHHSALTHFREFLIFQKQMSLASPKLIRVLSHTNHFLPRNAAR